MRTDSVDNTSLMYSLIMALEHHEYGGHVFTKVDCSLALIKLTSITSTAAHKGQFVLRSYEMCAL